MANPQQDHHSERMWRFVIQARRATGEKVSFPKMHRNPTELKILLKHPSVLKDQQLLQMGKSLLQELSQIEQQTIAAANNAPSTENAEHESDLLPNRANLKWRILMVASLLLVGLFVLWQISASKQQANLVVTTTTQNENPASQLPTVHEQSEIVAARPLTPSEIALSPGKKLFSVHGSNTIGAELMPALIQQWMYSRKLQQIQRQPVGESNEFLYTAKSGEQLQRIELKAHGSSTGFKALIHGEAEIAAASRPIKDKEHTALAELGDMRSQANEHVIAIDGLAMIVHPANPIRNIAIGQLKQIFNGEINNWSQLGQAAAPIQVYARDKNSGTFDIFKSLVLGKQGKLVQSARRFESNDKLSDEIARDRSGIGFVALPSVRHSRALALSDGGAAILPTRFTLATEDYPLTRRLFLYTADNASLEVRSLIDLALSEQGQQQVAKVGFVDLQPTAASLPVEANWPEAYRQLVDGSQRLSINFRFKRNTDLLDNKAERDIPRLVRYFSLPENSNKRIYLFGFTDNTGDSNYNLQLSRKRALSVANRLKQSGLPVILSEGFGDAIPIANNLNPRGRAKNRRVEIWVR
ncbi:substrate-binding domain-containing protein [Pelagibaculum spongiae]|uniref:OmpA-like domain-containing protein n=1 Tax=Pelagibaculum spongiae TaxID=2080658 RepID=A0A2V1GR91_9GAMM|nr:phosphate ABC transporter substrate-binding/OmpA family protein [Pelagibaculum spongiae]PVZ67598.1 hypothetical protein DC094_14255 [Pelagibaculum spongiae]